MKKNIAPNGFEPLTFWLYDAVLCAKELYIIYLENNL